MELQILVGKESKEWLRDAEALVTRLENVAKKIKVKVSGDDGIDESTDEATDDATDDDDDFNENKKEKKAKSDFEDEEDAGDFTSDDEEETEKPKKAKKLTVDDVNEACKKRAARTGGKEGRSEVLTILKKKFKTQSVSELKPEAYAACIAAMKA